MQPRTSLVSAVGSTLTVWRQSRSSIDTCGSAGVASGTDYSLRNPDTNGDNQTSVGNDKHGVRHYSDRGTVENAAAAAFADKMDQSDDEKTRQLSGQDNVGYVAEDVQTLETVSDPYIVESVPIHCGNQKCDQESDKICLETIQLTVHMCLCSVDVTNHPPETPESNSACKTQDEDGHSKLQESDNKDNVKRNGEKSS